MTYEIRMVGSEYGMVYTPSGKVVCGIRVCGNVVTLRRKLAAPTCAMVIGYTPIKHFEEVALPIRSFEAIGHADNILTRWAA